MPFGLGFFAVAGAGGAAGSFDLLQTVNGSGSTQVEFASLSAYAADYKHLQLRVTSRTSGTGSEDYLSIRINANSSQSQYATHALYANAGGLQTWGFDTNSISFSNRILLGAQANSQSGANANAFSASIIDILDFANTSKTKTIRTLFGNQDGAKYWIGLHSGFLVTSTAAIDNIRLRNWDSTSYATGSRFSLYGIKG